MMQSWPPAYTLKRHPRAKRVRLRASNQRGLEIIVPTSFNPKHLAALLDENRAWIEKHVSPRAAMLLSQKDFLPTELVFSALQMVWKVHYLPTESRLKLFVRPSQELVLVGSLQDKQACKQKLLRWIKAFATEQLLAFLARTSLEVGLAYSKGSVRNQATRWGSCSRTKAISLNYKLIFLPQAWVRHTLLHELCHTVHLDHSQRFWGLLATLDPDWQEHRRKMRKASVWLPSWLP